MTDKAGPVADKGLCPNCNAPVDARRARDQGDVQRAGCLVCGLQLVRRPGEGWQGIRG